MLRIKPGVRIHGMRAELALAATIIAGVFAPLGLDAVITAGIDGQHARGSFHYLGLAFDFRTRDLPAEKVQEVLAEIQACLGEDFDVLFEADHIHVEFQPKGAYRA